MNTEILQTLHIIATTLLAVIFILILKASFNRPRLIWMAAFVLCAAAYCFRVFSFGFSELYYLFNALEYFAPVFFVVCIRMIFLDNPSLGKIEKVSALLLLPMLAISTYTQMSGAQLLPSTLVRLFIPGGLAELSMETVVFNCVLWMQLFVVMLCVFAAFWLASRDWYSDLVDRRRTARRLFVFLGGPIILLIIGLHAAGLIWLEHSIWVLSSVAIVMSVSGLSFMIFALQIDPTVLPIFRDIHGLASNDEDLGRPSTPSSTESMQFGDSEAPGQPIAESASEYQEDLQLLTLYMDERAPYKEMGLKVDELAALIGIPEYRLRKTINQGLGFRNFNVYLNSYRIKAAIESLLQSPADTSILDISIDSGFKSLTSFNKAFKETTGLTPSEYRKRQKLDQS